MSPAPPLASPPHSYTGILEHEGEVEGGRGLVVLYLVSSRTGP